MQRAKEARELDICRIRWKCAQWKCAQSYLTKIVPWKQWTRYPRTNLPSNHLPSQRISPLSAAVTTILSVLSSPYPFVFLYFWCCRREYVKRRQRSIRVILCSTDVYGSNTWSVTYGIQGGMPIIKEERNKRFRETCSLKLLSKGWEWRE
jgi:hypothetical protein